MAHKGSSFHSVCSGGAGRDHNVSCVYIYIYIRISPSFFPLPEPPLYSLLLASYRKSWPCPSVSSILSLSLSLFLAAHPCAWLRLAAFSAFNESFRVTSRTDRFFLSLSLFLLIRGLESSYSIVDCRVVM